MAEHARTQRLRDRCLAAAFLAFLLAPLGAAGLRRATGSAAPAAWGAENRAAAEFPAAPADVGDWSHWPRRVESWHDDHFGLRVEMLRAHAWLAVFVLGRNPSPRLILGRANWMFTPPTSLDSWRGARPMTEPELEGWAKALESRRRELEKRGIAYLFALAPSKSEIYPEYLPARFRKQGPSRLDQFAARMGTDAEGCFLDLRPSLLDSKSQDRSEDRAYFPLGTHWTERGAFDGMAAIVRRLAQKRPELAEVPDVLAGTKPQDDLGDSLARQLFLGDRIRQAVQAVELDPGSRRELEIEPEPGTRNAVVTQAGTALPRAVIFHDSFGMPLPPLFGRHFSRSVYLWQPDIDWKVVEREKPDFVLQILSDRVLDLPPPSLVDAEGEARIRAQFEASTEVVLQFDPARNSPRISATRAGRVFVRGGGSDARVVCSSSSAADTFLLPAFTKRPGTRPVVRLVFESSVASSAGLFFQTRADPSYSRRRQLQFETHIGTNECIGEIVDPDFSGRLMFRPAQEVGTFEVRLLEVRLVPD